MSNRDFDDDFNFDDEFDSGSGDDLGDDLSPDFDGDSGDIPDLGDEPDDAGSSGGSGGGPSGAFIAIAAVMVILFLLGLGAVIFLALQDQGPSELELTATQITILNMTTIAQQTETNEAIIAFNATGTALANFTDTPTPRPTVTPTFTPTDSPTLDSTQVAALAFTQTAEAITLGATQTAIALQSSVPSTQPGINIDDVALTATALAALFNSTPTAGVIDDGQGGGVIPTQEGSSQLPNTGFIDDVVGGGRNGVGIVVLMGFGLVGVIFISRRLRAVNGK